MRDSVKNVYVVDDDEAVRDSLKVLLESYGMAVQEFACAEDFLRRDPEPKPTCLILDLHMPGMGGVELLEQLRKRSKMLPVIVITGRADAALRRRVERAGVVAMLEKPVDDVVLLQTVESVFATAAGRDA